MRVDSHQHFWTYSEHEYPWIGSGMERIRRDFLPDNLGPELDAAGIDVSVSVQARQLVQETEWLLELASSSNRIAGVVGWAPLTSPDVAGQLERFVADPKFKGVRHVLQDEPDDDYMLRADFDRGVSSLLRLGLAYDILIYERQLPQAIRFVDRHPSQVFILDHVAKPRVRQAELSPWRERILELARREHVYCKLSGMVTEADWGAWQAEDLRPYFELVLEAFGPNRLMFGSDWPVCLVASEYGRWCDAVGHFVGPLSETERDRILGRTAIEAYGLGG